MVGTTFTQRSSYILDASDTLINSFYDDDK
nr:MAG TPA: hypothetical protein [Caudoviricetes sp.]DAX57241.1 MAG TPA: hypothetical protein [Crassvirales sp.]